MSENTIKTALVEELAEILNEKNLTEIEYDTEDFRIRIAREVYASPAIQTVSSPANMVQAQAPVQTSTPGSQNIENHPGLVKAPMVGVIYFSPEPGAAPYVTVGSTVTSGQTLFLVEAMKTFNPIKATKSGKVSQILVSDGQPVEYDEPLLIVE